MLSVRMILLIVSFVCSLLAAFGVPSKVNLLALGLAFFVAAFLFV
jgi:hypothetical protein